MLGGPPSSFHQGGAHTPIRGRARVPTPPQAPPRPPCASLVVNIFLQATRSPHPRPHKYTARLHIRGCLFSMDAASPGELSSVHRVCPLDPLPRRSSVARSSAVFERAVALTPQKPQPARSNSKRVRGCAVRSVASTPEQISCFATPTEKLWWPRRPPGSAPRRTPVAARG